MSRKVDKVSVGGFSFFSKDEEELAKKEQEGVKYIRSKTDMDKPEMVLQIYNKMIEQNFFVTAVGNSYLKELQEYLHTIPFIRNEDVQPIPVRHPAIEKEIRKERIKQRVQQKNMKSKLEEVKRSSDNSVLARKYKLSMMINLILVCCIIGMFLISMTSSNPTVLNYEAKLLDKYATWEQDLTEREQEIRVKESELGILEEK